MSVGILIMTHPGIGTSILHSANRILGSCPLNTRCIEVPYDASESRTEENAKKMLQQLDQGQGVLILTDIYGATPNNLARVCAKNTETAVLAGLNLPMLLRVFNYSDTPLNELYEMAIEGAKRGIVHCETSH